MNERCGRRKQPLLVRARLVKAASEVAAERGLGDVTLDAVARKAGVSKGGLIHHFPNRRALIEGMCRSLLEDFGALVEAHLDEEDRPGRFTRAYVRATAVSRGNRLLGLFLLAMSGDDELAAIWREWLRGRMEHYGEDAASVTGMMIRYAADGLWLDDCTGGGVNGPDQRAAVVERLVGLSYTM